MVTGAPKTPSPARIMLSYGTITRFVKSLKVKKDQEVTVTFYAKASEGPIEKKSDLDNI